MHSRPPLIAGPIALVRVGAAFALAITALLTYPAHAIASELLITSIEESGSGNDGRRHFRISGSFPQADELRAEALCNGKLTPSALVAATEAAVDLSIPEPQSRTRCTFRLSRLSDGIESLWSRSVSLADPRNEITGSRDRAPHGTRHFIELYGSFPDFAALDATYGINCNGWRAGSPQIEYRSSTQLNISFDEAPGASCTFVLGYGDGRRTNLWGPVELRQHDVEALEGFGLYHWPEGAALNYDVTDTIASGQRAISLQGFDVARFWLAPSMRKGNYAVPVPPYQVHDDPYHQNIDVHLAECPVGTPFLPCMARSESYQRAFRSPHLRVIMLTVADSASTGDFDPFGAESPARLADPSFFTPENTAKVTREYRDLALAIYETQRNTGKTFIISNWETDNVIMCGDLGKYFRDSTFRTECDYGHHGGSPFIRVQGLKMWFNARKKGIKQARAIAEARGLSGVVVADAIEFNSVRQLHNSRCRSMFDLGSPMLRCPNTLDDIIPFVGPEYASYSAWESIRDDPEGAPPGTGRLDADLRDLKTNRFPGTAGTPKLIIGEFGVNFLGLSPSSSQGIVAAWAMAQTARAVQRAQLAVNIGWAAYNKIPPDAGEDGLLEADGRPRYALNLLRQALVEGASEIAQGAMGTIAGIIVKHVPGSYWDLWEMYGSFPADVSGITVICNNDAVSGVQLLGVTADRTQMNLRIPHRDRHIDPDHGPVPWYCIVKVPGILTHGPKIMPP